MKFLQSNFLVFILVILAVNAAKAQWVPTNGPIEGRTYMLAVGISSAGDTTLYAGTWNGGVFSSTDKGNSWSRIDGWKWWTTDPLGDTGFISSDIIMLTATPNGNGGTCLFALDARSNLFRSLNADTNWTAISLIPSNHNIGLFAVITDTTIYATTDSAVFLSNNLGTSWTKYNNNELASYAIYSLIVMPDGINNARLFATTSEGIFISTNNGVNWTVVNSEARNYYGLVVNHNKITGEANFYATDGRSIFRSTDNGVHWTTAGDFGPDIVIYCLAVSDSVLFAGTDRSGVGYSLDYGKNWMNGNYGFPSSDMRIYMLLVSSNYLYAATSSSVGSSSSVWRRPLSDIVTGIVDNHKENPSEFVLRQNYPNPFNPTTTISFSLPNRVYVSLKIYDSIGREIKALISEELSAGNHTHIWNASDMPSGVYFYRLQTGTFSETKKLILIK